MSTTDEEDGSSVDGEDEVNVEGEDLDAPPEVGLEWLCDEDTDCQELTVFDPSAENPTTTWISVDADATVPLEEAQ